MSKPNYIAQKISKEVSSSKPGQTLKGHCTPLWPQIVKKCVIPKKETVSTHAFQKKEGLRTASDERAQKLIRDYSFRWEELEKYIIQASRLLPRLVFLKVWARLFKKNS